MEKRANFFFLSSNPQNIHPGPECARAVSSYLNLDALEEHLRETVENEVATYRRNILPLILSRAGDITLSTTVSKEHAGMGEGGDSPDTSPSRTTHAALEHLLSAELWEPLEEGEAAAQSQTPAAITDKPSSPTEVTADGKLPSSEAIVAAGVAALNEQHDRQKFGKLVLDEHTKVEYEKLHMMTLGEFDMLLHACLDRNQPGDVSQQPSEEFEVSLQVALTKFSRKPYVR